MTQSDFGGNIDGLGYMACHLLMKCSKIEINLTIYDL